MELTNGMIMLFGCIGGFAFFLISLIVFLAVTSKKMKKILNNGDKPKE